MVTTLKKPIGTLVSTGHACPESGVWQAQKSPFGTAPLAKGNIAPPYHGTAVNWKLIQYA